ncbi:MAG: xanthine dehydrogenase family protein molybdopterin-binding subunit [Candidatus Bipolaricaulia bacterium]
MSRSTTQDRSEHRFKVVGRNVRRVDGRKLVVGAPAFTDDFSPSLPGMLHAKILGSPYPHARIKRIDTRAAEALDGVHAVLTHKDVPQSPGPIGRRAGLFDRVAYTRAGQDHPEPSPWDYFLLDDKVRYIGDRVAAVAAETLEIAEEACNLIEVDYEILPAVFDPIEAMQPGAPVIHDEKDSVRIHDPERNICAHVDVEIGDVEQGFAEADVVVENEYQVPHVQHAQMELHITISYFDEDDRLVVICSSQVPFHVRRQLAQVLGMPISRIRVIKPRIGGGFGGKQEMVVEDICAALTVATHRPVRLELDREEDLTCARTRHPMMIRMKTGVNRDGTITANQMEAIVNAGAYGSHSPTVPTNTGNKNLPRYPCPNTRFKFDAVYTNLPISGAMRGYGTPQGAFAIECQMDEVAKAIGMDPLEFRLKNTIREGDMDQLSPLIYEVETQAQGDWTIRSCGLQECIERGAQAIGWHEKRNRFDELNRRQDTIKRGVGMACLSQGSGVANIDTATATIKINEDGSFNLMVGAADIGTGGDTVLCQIAAEVLGVDVSDMVIYTTDTDLTPFDSGAYASSTTYVSGGAVKRAAEKMRDEILNVAARVMGERPEDLKLEEKEIRSRTSGERVSLADVAMHSLYKDKVQIEVTASFCSPSSPPPFAAQFAEVEVDTETGVINVVNFVSAVDAGTVINPPLAEGQVEGAVLMGLGYALVEELKFDEEGRALNRSLLDYRILKSTGIPKLETILVETYEPSGPYGVKAIAEIPINGPAPAVANAVAHALGVRIRGLPIIPEKVLRALGNM